MEEAVGFEFEDGLEISFPAIKEDPAKRFAFKAIHRKVVCRYWLNNCCKKGDTCEFLHSFDEERMPECRKGALCGDPSCFLKHPSKDDKAMCPNFAAGFCSLGHSCQWRHDIVESSPPPIAQLFLANDPAKEWIASRRRSQRSFRTAPCPYFHNDGWCPYFLNCAFSHDMKPLPVAVQSLALFPPLPTRPAVGVPVSQQRTPLPFTRPAPVRQHDAPWRGRGNGKRGHSRGSSTSRPPPNQRARFDEGRQAEHAPRPSPQAEHAPRPSPQVEQAPRPSPPPPTDRLRLDIRYSEKPWGDLAFE